MKWTAEIIASKLRWSMHIDSEEVLIARSMWRCPICLETAVQHVICQVVCLAAEGWDRASNGNQTCNDNANIVSWYSLGCPINSGRCGVHSFRLQLHQRQIRQQPEHFSHLSMKICAGQRMTSYASPRHSMRREVFWQTSSKVCSLQMMNCMTMVTYTAMLQGHVSSEYKPLTCCSLQPGTPKLGMVQITSSQKQEGHLLYA